MLHLLLYGVLAILLGGVLFAAGARFLPAGEQIAPPVRDEPPWELPPDRAIRAEDVDAVRLPVALRGYRFAETDQLLDRLAGELRARDAELARLRGELDVPVDEDVPAAEELPFEEAVNEVPVDEDVPVAELPVEEADGYGPVVLVKSSGLGEDEAPVADEPAEDVPANESIEPVALSGDGAAVEGVPGSAEDAAVLAEPGIAPTAAEHDDELADALAVNEALEEPPRSTGSGRGARRSRRRTARSKEPAADAAAVEQPEPEPVAGEQPAVEAPIVERPAAEASGEQPAVEAPAGEEPAAERPAEQQPAHFAVPAQPLLYVAPPSPAGAVQPGHWMSAAPPWAVGRAPWLAQGPQPDAPADGQPAEAVPADQQDEPPKRGRRRRKRS